MIQALTISDTSKISCLIVPGQTRSTSSSGRIPAHLELGIPSISFSHPQPNKNTPPLLNPSDSLQCSTSSSNLLKPDPLLPILYGWYIPLGYIISSLLISLCNIIAPLWIRNCAFFVCPIWSISLGMHSLLQQGAFMWYGVFLMTTYPIVVLLQEPLALDLYIFFFAVFSTWKFWIHHQGPCFILICVCCGGIITGCGWAFFSVDPRPQLTVAGFCSVIASSLCIRKTNKLGIRVSV